MMNLHNHTTYSDGKLTPREVVEAAIGYGLGYVAITDHYATRKAPCVEADALGQYTASLKELRRRFKGEIRVLIGVELDASHERTNFNALPYDKLGDLDLVLAEYVQDSLWRGMDLWEFLPIRERMRCPVGLAHNDLGKNFAKSDLEGVVGVLQNNSIFIELCSSLRNSKFEKPYYRYAESFFEASRGRVAVSVGTDTHYEKGEVGDISDAMEFVKKMGLENDLVTNRYWK